MHYLDLKSITRILDGRVVVSVRMYEMRSRMPIHSQSGFDRCEYCVHTVTSLSPNLARMSTEAMLPGRRPNAKIMLRQRS